jgi:hypothetical protein
MSKTQDYPIGNNFKAEVVQRNLEDLFKYSHTHDVRTTVPTDRDGLVGDLVPVLLDGIGYLYIKFPSIGWKRVVLS